MRPIANAGLTLFLLVVLALELLSMGATLEYRRTLLAVEPWRLLTGHLVHLSLIHAMLNGVALLLLNRLFAGRVRTAEFWIVLGATPVLISLVFWITLPELAWYRGLSGALHALYFAGCIVWWVTARGKERWLPIAAIAAGAIKVLLEQPWNADFPYREWLGGTVVPQAHLIGAAVGIIAGLAFSAIRTIQTRTA